MSSSTDQHPRRPGYVDFVKLAPKAHAALIALSACAAETDLDTQLVELVKLRASQMNGCAFCLQFHLDLARKAGLSESKIDLLAAWREAGIYSAREVAALAWAEHLTDVSRLGAPDSAWLSLGEHFSQAQILGLCAALAAINAWNRLGVGLRFAPALQG